MANVKTLFEEHKSNPYLEWVKLRIITIAFDEAAPLAMLTENDRLPAVPLRIVRRAASNYNAGNKLAFVLSGTSSKMANFAPPIIWDKSLRMGEPFFRLFPPFILRYQDTYVPNYTRSLMDCDDLYSRIVNREIDKEFYFLGRPLWGSEYHVNKMLEMSTLIDKAKFKLKGGKLNWLAVLMIRAAINIYPLSYKADELVASNMASLNAFSRDDNILMISYISEPILAMAASKLVGESSEPKDTQKSDLKPEDSIRSKILKYLYSVSNFEMENIGTRGEYIFQLICIEVVDKITNYNPVKPIQLAQFLSCLFGKEVFDCMKGQLPAGIDAEACLISLLQFKYFECILNLETLRLALIRGVGIVARRGNAGFDICIPFICPSGDVSGLFIEVKNTTDKFTKMEKFELLKKEADNISKNGIKVLVNLRRGSKDCSKEPLSKSLETIFHIDHLCARTEVHIPEEYIRLLAPSTKYTEIAAIRSMSMAPFKDNEQPDQFDVYLDSCLDLGMTCLPCSKNPTIMNELDEGFVEALQGDNYDDDDEDSNDDYEEKSADNDTDAVSYDDDSMVAAGRKRKALQ